MAYENGRMAERISALAAVAAFIGAVTINVLANALPFNGYTTGILSDMLPNLFVPAGFTFAVWGVIYLLLADWVTVAVFQAFKNGNTRGWTPHDGLLFVANMVANAAWVLCWHWRMVPLTLVCMAVILATLILLVERRHRFRMAWGRDTQVTGVVSFRGRAALWCLEAPLKVYLGWICVATIANVTAVLVDARWDGFGIDPVWWTLAAMVAAGLIGVLMVVLRGNVWSTLVIVWALAGIAAKRLGTDPESTVPVWVGALVIAGLLAVVIAAFLVARSLRERQEP